MQILSAQQAAELLGVTTRRLFQIAKEADPPPKDSSGKYPAKLYGDWLRTRYRDSLNISDDGEVLDFNAERARLTKEQADKAATENAKLRGELVSATAVQDMLTNILSVFKTRVLAVPSKVAPILNNLSPNECREIIDNQLRECLEELSRLDAAAFDDKPRAARGEAAAEAND